MVFLYKKYIVTFLFVFSGFRLGADIAFREQFNIQFLKKCNLTDPSSVDKAKINLCYACSDYGSPKVAASGELFQAMKSVDIFEVMSRHFQTKTQFGCRAIAEQCLYGFTDNIQDLLKHQERIHYLQLKHRLAQQMVHIIAQMNQAEAVFLNLFKPLDAQAKIERDLIENKLYFSFPWLKRYNENPYILGSISRINASALVGNICSIALVPIALKFQQDKSDENIAYKAIRAIGNGVKEIHKTPEMMVEMYEPVYGYTASAYITGQFFTLVCYQMYVSSKMAKEIFDLTYEKQADLLQVGHLIKSLKIIYELLEKDEQLKILIPECEKLGQLFDINSKEISQDLRLLIDELLSSSFQSEESYWFSDQGKILATHHLLCRIKGELVPYFEALGRIDGYLAVYELYMKFKGHNRVKFCFPEYIESVSPILILQDFWHPLIDVNKVMSNSLCMGTSSSNTNLIITGPNAGGKTTSLTSLIINIIFAQSFGIAPASSLRIAPFAKIHSCLDITTNLTEGLSLFAAEVDRVKKLKNSIMSCEPGQKTFTIIDEMFSGTQPDVAAKLGFDFALKLGRIPYSMTIITTHFPHLTTLEKESVHFENYKVADAIIAVDGSLRYPFKLVKGISTQNIAQHMLESAGVL